MGAISSKTHREKTKKGQRQAEAERKAAEKAHEETRAFLKETEPGFREEVLNGDLISGQPSEQQAARAAARAQRAQVAGDRRVAKEVQREDMHSRVADVFGL